MDSQAKWLEMAGQWQQTLMQQWTQMASAGGPAGHGAQAFANNPFAALAQMGMAGFAGTQQGAQAGGAGVPWADMSQAMAYLQDAVSKDAALGSMPTMNAATLLSVQQNYNKT